MGQRAPSFQGDNIFSGRVKSFGAHSPVLKNSSYGKKVNTDSESGRTVKYEKGVAASECFDQAACVDSYYYLPAFNLKIMNEMRQPRCPIDGWAYASSYEPYCRPHWFPQYPVLMVPQSYAPDYTNIQDFQYFVVIDFEATCDKIKHLDPQEIIEFPSVLVNSTTWELEDSFQVYVRPTHNKELTSFCKALTGIQQSQVDKGILLSDALMRHDKWLEKKGVKNTSFAIVTWSNSDCGTILESECRLKKINKPPYFNSWINLNVPFAEAYGDGRCKLREAVERAGLTWEGRAHCGLDDAKNTARLLVSIMAGGLKLSITNTLMPRSADHPSPPETNPSYFVTPYKYQGTTCSTVIPSKAYTVKEPRVYCNCGVVAERLNLVKNDHDKGGFYYRCRNSTLKGPSCRFYKWVPSPEPPVKARK